MKKIVTWRILWLSGLFLPSMDMPSFGTNDLEYALSITGQELVMSIFGWDFGVFLAHLEKARATATWLFLNSPT